MSRLISTQPFSFIICYFSITTIYQLQPALPSIPSTLMVLLPLLNSLCLLRNNTSPFTVLYSYCKLFQFSCCSTYASEWFYLHYDRYRYTQLPAKPEKKRKEFALRSTDNSATASSENALLFLFFLTPFLRLW